MHGSKKTRILKNAAEACTFFKKRPHSVLAVKDVTTLAISEPLQDGNKE